MDLADTTLENKKFSEIKIDNGDDDWIFCKVENSIFEGFGDSKKLTTILETFQDWAMNSFDFV
ncbi:MAG: immunity 53 family protein [Eubacterium sp.]|nr:immunity 53 family protein [Eubacterium sp.]